MTSTCTELKTTTDFLQTLAIAKEREISMFIDKILKLRKACAQDPRSVVKELKYKLALERYENLQKDTVDLRELEQRLEHLL